MTIAMPAGYRHQAFDELPSTNAVAARAMADGDPGRLWITAVRQTAGRGRRGRSWSTEAGNLAASLALVDPSPRDIAATLSLIAGVALHQAVVDLSGPAVADRLALKWPNDLLLDRYKIAGILVEGETLPSGAFGVVIGIGVNCRSHPEISAAFPASSLTDRGLPATPDRLFAALVGRMASEAQRWDKGAGFTTTRKAWLARATGLGETVTVRLPDHSVSGRFEALDDDGHLVLRCEDGRLKSFAAGDVAFGAG